MSKRDRERRKNEKALKAEKKNAIKRYLSEPLKNPDKWQSRTFGLKDEMATEFGLSMSYWTQVEEHMTQVMSDLLAGKHTQRGSLEGRRVFWGMQSQQSRINVMRALLQRTWINTTAPKVYDEIIDEFDRLRNLRNDYAHGLWYTSEGETLFCKPGTDTDGVYDEPVVVTWATLLDFRTDMQRLMSRILNRMPKPE